MMTLYPVDFPSREALLAAHPGAELWENNAHEGAYSHELWRALPDFYTCPCVVSQEMAA